MRSVFPPCRVSAASFTILLVAEGYTAAEEGDFAALCHQFRNALLGTAPFGHLWRNQDRVSVWRLFTASAQHGPALGTTPGNTALRSTYNPATGSLALDEDALDSLLMGVSIPGLGGGYMGSTYLAEQALLPYAGLVAVLLPANAGGTAISAELDANPGSPAGPSYVAVTVNDGWERVIIRAVGRGLGLGDESSLPDAGHAVPPASALVSAGFFPNLFADAMPLGEPGFGFKWFWELSGPARRRPVTVVPFGQASPTPSEQIQLFEGGGGYRSRIYRSAADCLMRRRPGAAGADSPRRDGVGFCTICLRYLTRVIVGTDGRVETVTLSSQRLEFDQVDLWEHTETITGAFPVTRSATARTGRAGPWWAYQATAGPATRGLQIQNLKLMDQGAESLATENVAELIEFRDVAVELDNGEVVPFDFNAAFANAGAPPVLLSTTDGRVESKQDSGYLRGVKLTLTDDLQGRCPVRLEQSLVLKGEAANIDPGGQIFAVKFYPQIALTWTRSGERSVKRFRACVRVLCNNKVKGGHSHEPPPDETIASFFTDSHPAGAVRRRMECRVGEPMPPALVPAWTLIFDYHKSHPLADVEIPGIYGPRAPAVKRTGRWATCTWPPGASNVFGTFKMPGEGAYDNVHLHGAMGVDAFDPAGGQMIHAPGCAEACIHLHWRWGLLGGLPLGPAGTGFMNFHGWPRTEGFVRAHHPLGLGLPLIPPNQDLWVALTSPATSRANPMDPVVTASRPLDPARKAIWYTVDVTRPAAGERQVLLEPGISFAFRYNWVSYQLAKTIQWIRELRALGPATISDEEVQHRAYSEIRWFVDAAGHVTSEQIPLGDQVVSGGTTLEAL